MTAFAALAIALSCASGLWGAEPATGKPVDTALAGRMLVVSNGLVRCEIAPEVGARMMALQREAGAAIIRNEAEYSQTKEAVWTSAGSAGLSEGSVGAWLGTGEGVAVARVEQTVDCGKDRLTVRREYAVCEGLPAVMFRLSITNAGPQAASGVGYAIRPHLTRADGIELLGEQPLDGAALERAQVDLPGPAVHVRTAADEWLAEFPDANYRLNGYGYMIRADHNLSAGSIPPGETRTSLGAWWMTPRGALPRERVLPPWPERVTFASVEPLNTPQGPPADLPRTPLAAGGPWGVCGGSGPEYVPLWQAAGIKWIRSGFGWAGCEPGPGSYRFDRTDAMVAACERAGISLIGLLLSSPSWATVDGGRISPIKDMAAWERYTEVLASRYRGRVQVWEVWNEPDIGEFFTGTVQDYVAMLAGAYRGLKRGNPDCLVMSAGLDGPGERYLAEMIQAGAMDHCDLVGFHPYGGDPQKSEERMRTVWRILNYHNIRKPVWITEVGWQSGGWKSGPGVVDSEATKAKHLSGAYEHLAPLAEVICWYVDREAGDMYGLVKPADGGLVLNDAFHAMARASGAAQAPGLRLSGPASVTAKAGETCEYGWTVTNETNEPLRVQVSMLEPLAFAPVRPAEFVLPGLEKASFEVSFTPPEYAIPRRMPLVVVAAAERGPAQAVTLELDLVNEGASYGLRVTRQWGISVDAGGRETGKWTPTDRLITAPGGRMRQPYRVINDGSVTETFNLKLSGPAAEWVSDFPASVSVPPSKEQWIGATVSVPEGTPTGSYPLTLTVSSARYPQISEQVEMIIPVGPAAPQ